jgi:hypothetical protein
MFTALSANTRRIDLGEQKRLHKQELRVRLRRLRKRVRHAAYVEREKALTYRLLACRFAPDSPQRSLLHILARSAMRRRRRLEGLLYQLPGPNPLRLPKRWCFGWRCWYLRHAPRNLALLQLKP